MYDVRLKWQCSFIASCPVAISNFSLSNFTEYKQSFLFILTPAEGCKLIAGEHENESDLDFTLYFPEFQNMLIRPMTASMGSKQTEALLILWNTTQCILIEAVFVLRVH